MLSNLFLEDPVDLLESALTSETGIFIKHAYIEGQIPP